MEHQSEKAHLPFRLHLSPQMISDEMFCQGSESDIFDHNTKARAEKRPKTKHQ